MPSSQFSFSDSYTLTWQRERAGDRFRLRILDTLDGWRWVFERQLAEGEPFVELESRLTAKRPSRSAAKRWGERRIGER